MSTAATATPNFTPEIAKAVLEMNIASLEFEQPVTKAVIQAITQPNFKIDPNSRTAIELAWHIVCSDLMFLDQIANLKFEMHGEPPVPATVADIIQYYETEFPKSAARLRALSPQQLLTPINFANLFNFPAFMYTNFAVNHHVHHRGQLAAFLRPMGSKCPSIYGGSFDVPFQMPEQAA